MVPAAPLLLAIGLTVRASLGGPVFFRQWRAGKGGVPFRIIKFRTMTNARDSSGRLLPDEKRTPAVGRLLRRSRLDELPELINIVRGEMAFVGPRPLLPDTVVEMGAAGMLRGSVAPGLTGLAQVSGNTLLSQDEKLAIDLRYVRERTAWLDAAIIVRTVGVVIGGERKKDGSDNECDPRRRC
jgi:Sugar transferases involved in lipopolysaccharide synthesis